jgi:hypothetical protein
MSLPILSHPKFNDTIPSTKQPISYRPFLVKEQKILLMAAESKDPKSIEQATKDVLKACILTKIDIDSLATFDIEYLFLRLRSKSVGEKLTLTFHHHNDHNREGVECKVHTKFEVDLDTVNVEFDPVHSKDIKLTDDIIITMRYPTFDVLSKLTDATVSSSNNPYVNIVAESIETIFQGEQTFSSTDYTLEDKVAFIENLTETQFTKILKFFETMPKLKHIIKYKCTGCDQEDQYKLEGLTDFF